MPGSKRTASEAESAQETSKDGFSARRSRRFFDSERPEQVKEAEPIEQLKY